MNWSNRSSDLIVSHKSSSRLCDDVKSASMTASPRIKICGIIQVDDDLMAVDCCAGGI